MITYAKQTSVYPQTLIGALQGRLQDGIGVKFPANFNRIWVCAWI